MTITRCKQVANVLAAVFTMAMVPAALPALADSPAPSSVSSYSADETALRQQADTFAKAFAAGDAKAIADLWAPDGNLITAEGMAVHGRDQIQKLYGDYFAANGGQPMEIKIESFHFPSADVAVEEGVAKVLRPNNQAATRYSVVHVKKNGQWLMSDVTETAYLPSSSAEYLKDLSWLIGDWTAESAKDKIHLRAHWVANNHFILCTFRPEGSAQEGFSDAEVIGWDPEKHHIYSSTYGVDGGFGRAVWARDGQSWILKAWAVQPDGTRATAQYIFHPLDQNTFTWRSLGRTVDGKPLPDVNEIKVARDIASK